jgi:PAS domain S-box-containing protein
MFLEFNLRTIFENGKAVGIHGIARDVNKRLKAEKNMLIFSKAFNLATDGIGISDSKHKINFVNESGAKLFGYSRRELLGQPATIFYAEEDLPNLEENITPAMEKYGYWNGLILGRKKNGSVIPIEITLSSVLDHNGKPLVNIGVFREVKSNISNS